jgi:hypothetical protein
MQATDAGQLDELMQLLAKDFVFWGDGGGMVRSAAIYRSLQPETVSQFVVASPYPFIGNGHDEPAAANKQPATMIHAGSNLIAVPSAPVDHGRVEEMRALSNPDKRGGVSGHTRESEEVTQ